MKSLEIICFGEVLWDIFPQGKKIGGAPFNVACSLHQLGNQVGFISRIGTDALGKEIEAQMDAIGVNKALLQYDTLHPTGTVSISLDSTGAASYTIIENVAWDHIALENEAVEAVAQSKAFIFGSLIARSDAAKTLEALLVKAPFSVFDVNLRAPYYTLSSLKKLMQAAHMIKFNDDELYEIAEQLGSPFHSLDQHLQYIQEITQADYICVTKGSHGAVLFHHHSFYYNSGYKVKVKDTVGAGDSFLATLISGILQQRDLQLTLNRACGMGALVAASEGANPNISEAELDAFVNPQ